MWAESALSTGGHSLYLETSGRGVSPALQRAWPASAKGQGQPRRAGPASSAPQLAARSSWTKARSLPWTPDAIRALG